MAKSNGNGTRGIGDNSQSLSEQGKSFVERIETLEADIDKETTDFKDTVLAPLKSDVKSVYDEAKAAGLTKKSIKAVITARKKERQALDAREKLDIADRDTFDNIRLKLGDLAELPLGKAALGSAEGAAA